jgi:F0F1-type ATP synthase assembly protein I
MTNAPEEKPRKDGRQDRDESDRLVDAVVGPASGLQDSFQRAGRTAGASYTLIGAIVLLGGLGYFGDLWLGTGPWLMVGGLLFGMVVGFYELARVVWGRKR